MSAVVTRGFLFSIALVATAGYTAGAAIVITGSSDVYTIPAEDRTYTVPAEL